MKKISSLIFYFFFPLQNWPLFICLTRLGPRRLEFFSHVHFCRPASPSGTVRSQKNAGFVSSVHVLFIRPSSSADRYHHDHPNDSLINVEKDATLSQNVSVCLDEGNLQS